MKSILTFESFATGATIMVAYDARQPYTLYGVEIPAYHTTILEPGCDPVQMYLSQSILNTLYFQNGWIALN